MLLALLKVSADPASAGTGFLLAGVRTMIRRSVPVSSASDGVGGVAEGLGACVGVEDVWEMS